MNHNLLLQCCLLFQRVDPRGESSNDLPGFFSVFTTPAGCQNPTNDQIDNDDKENKFHNISLGKSVCNSGILLKL